jgi:hypothetical protein
MAEQTSGSGATGIVAIVAIVLLVMMGFFVLRGYRRGNDGPSFKGNIEMKAPQGQSAPGGQGTPR